ncbi:hypothetical protein EJB05_16186, partial [Eragrostis curvula]
MGERESGGEMSEHDSAAAAAACCPALPEDVVVEILERVSDVVSLFRCAFACKQWHRLVADPAFLRRRIWPEGGRSLLGFFVQRHHLSVNTMRKVTKHFPTRAPALVPAPGSVLGPERRFLTSFVRDDIGLLDQAKPLAVRDGLLLVRIWPRPGDKKSILRLCVCDLLAGRWNLLPALDAGLFDDQGVRGYAVLTAADHGAGPHRPVDGYSTVFQVFLIGVRQDERQMYLLKFSSSATASHRVWTSYNCSSQIPRGLWGPFGCRIAAVSGGAAHWLFHGNGPDHAPSLYTLDVSVNTGRVSMTKLPLDVLPRTIRVDRDNVWLCLNMDGRLSLCCLNKNILLTLADGDQSGTDAWHLTQAIVVGVEVGLFGIESLSSVCIGEKSGTLLALYHSEPDRAYALDLQSGSTTKIAGWNRSFNYMTAVPCEINWQVFFMSRLRPLL